MVITGDMLGEMKDELDGDVITEFVTGGAKNYDYQTSQTITTMVAHHFQPLSIGRTTVWAV